MSSNHKIEIKLFDLLKEIEPLLRRAIINKDKNLELLSIIKIRNNLSAFSKNFFIQFFYKGYDFLIDGLNELVLKKLVELDTYPKKKPKKMIEYFSKFMGINSDLMADRYSREIKISPQVYCNFLPQLFEVFNIEGKGIILNFNQVMEEIEITIKNIQKICLR